MALFSGTVSDHPLKMCLANTETLFPPVNMKIYHIFFGCMNFCEALAASSCSDC